MASTNKTTHYDLSQFVGSDTPAWLSDYNGDMGKIDTAINESKTQADVAKQTADNAIENADNAQQTANTAVTNAAAADAKAETAGENIGAMAELETANKTTLVDAINEVNTKASTSEVVDSLEGAQTDKAPSVYAVNQKLAIGKDYSTSETDTGKVWVDGKKIYRKVINLGSLPNNSRKEVSTGLTSGYITSVQGLIINSEKTVFIPFPDTRYNTYIIAYINKIIVSSATDFSASTGIVIIEYTK